MTTRKLREAILETAIYTGGLEQRLASIREIMAKADKRAKKNGLAQSLSIREFRRIMKLLNVTREG